MFLMRVGMFSDILCVREGGRERKEERKRGDRR